MGAKSGRNATDEGNEIESAEGTEQMRAGVSDFTADERIQMTTFKYQKGV
jgi:hypothetical protein